MKTARWRNGCAPAWPAQAVSWLRTHGSLTVRLQRSYGQFRVQVRRQGCGVVLPDEAALLGMQASRQVRLRQVTLWAGDKPRVVAHTAVKWLGAQSDWPFWRQLGTRSLGTVLFRDRRVQRKQQQFASLPPRHPLALQARRVGIAQGLANRPEGLKGLDGLNAAGSAVSGADAIQNGQRWYARRAVYQRATGRTPLLVTEVFLAVDLGKGSWSLDGM
jgi:chorismate--pyruvate lyase